MDERPLKVLLADDHRLILDRVRAALEATGEFEITGEATKGSQVLPLVARTHPLYESEETLSS